MFTIPVTLTFGRVQAAFFRMHPRVRQGCRFRKPTRPQSFGVSTTDLSVTAITRPIGECLRKIFSNLSRQSRNRMANKQHDEASTPDHCEHAACDCYALVKNSLRVRNGKQSRAAVPAVDDKSLYH
jgi:hypothetical protein